MTGAIVPPGGDDHTIFHYGAAVTAIAYAFGAWPMSIWYHRKWSTTIKDTIDAAIYGAATGLIFTWMWPKM